MKRSLWALPMLALIAMPVMAKDQTLLEEEDVWKLYSKFEVKVTEIGSDVAELGGVQVGTILNDQLGFGLGVYALLNDVESDNAGIADPNAFDIWWLGATVDYDFAPASLLHPSIYVFAGGGWMNLEGVGDAEADDEKHSDFLFLEPGLNLSVNLNETVELGLGVGYRITNGSDGADGFKDGDLSAMVGNIFVKFTEF
jgi:hypothetical protein